MRPLLKNWLQTKPELKYRWLFKASKWWLPIIEKSIRWFACVKFTICCVSVAWLPLVFKYSKFLQCFHRHEFKVFCYLDIAFLSNCTIHRPVRFILEVCHIKATLACDLDRLFFTLSCGGFTWLVPVGHRSHFVSFGPKEGLFVRLVLHNFAISIFIFSRASWS